MALGNGRCAHQEEGFSQCLELGSTSREVRLPGLERVVYLVPLCAVHAEWMDDHKPRTNQGGDT